MELVVWDLAHAQFIHKQEHYRQLKQGEPQKCEPQIIEINTAHHYHHGKHSEKKHAQKKVVPKKNSVKTMRGIVPNAEMRQKEQHEERDVGNTIFHHRLARFLVGAASYRRPTPFPKYRRLR